MNLQDKIIKYFEGKVVRKDLTKMIKGNAVVPSYVLEYLLGQHCAVFDKDIIEKGLEKVKNIIKEHYVHRNEAELVKSTIKEKGRHKIIDRVTVELNDKTGCYEARFSNLGLKRVLIETNYIKKHPKLLVGGVWCIIDMIYEYTEDTKQVPWSINTLKPIQISHVDLDAYLESRKHFTSEEWIDILIQSIGMEPKMFNKRAKMLQLIRLIPFCERNYNLIELGPKGTGKSHIYSEFSPHGILISGGEVTVPKLFVNNATGKIGLVGYWDTVAFDEFAGKDKKSDKSLVDILKNYMANKSFSRGIETLGAEASLAFLGNTRHTLSYMLKHSDLFSVLPDKYYDTAFLDRLHFYIPGWELDIIRGEMFTDSYGFIVDYLAEVLKKLRNDDYSNFYNRYFELHSDISTRDKTSINKTFSGLLKLLYPNQDASKEEIRYLLEFSIQGRKRIKDQLLKIDKTYEEVNFSYTDLEDDVQKGVYTQEEIQYPSLFKKVTRDEDKKVLSKDLLKRQKDDEGAHKTQIDDVELIRELINKGEGKTIEFKKSMRWDYHQNKLNKDLEHEVIKTIAAFANTNGGHLLIGVTDNRDIVGLKNDYKILGKKQNADGFKLQLGNILNYYLGKDIHSIIDAEILKINEFEICFVKVRRSSKPVHVHDDQFFIRGVASTEQLKSKKMIEYIKDHW